jgi:hypothetical protein
MRTYPRPLTRVDIALRWMVVVTFVLTAGTLATASYWLIRPYTGLETFSVSNVSAVVEAGSIYRWDVSYCASTSTPVPITMTRELELQNHQTRFPIPSLDYVVSERCESFQRAMILPIDTPPGQYHLHIHTRLEVNPLRTVRQEWQGPNFTVVAPQDRHQGVQGPQGKIGRAHV